MPKLFNARRCAIAVVIAALSLSAYGANERYAVVNTPHPVSDGCKVEVIEVFWYGCPDCGRLELPLQALMDRLPTRVEFRRMPAVNPRWEPHARAFFAADQIGQLDCYHSALSEAMQQQRRHLMDEDALVDFAAELGIDAEAFRRAYRSPEVEQRVHEAKQLTRRFGVDAVPALVVNRRYLTSLRLAGDQAALIETAHELIREELADQSIAGNQRRR